jgi:hypothetical protein
MDCVTGDFTKILVEIEKQQWALHTKIFTHFCARNCWVKDLQAASFSTVTLIAVCTW